MFVLHVKCVEPTLLKIWLMAACSSVSGSGYTILYIVDLHSPIALAPMDIGQGLYGNSMIMYVTIPQYH